ncbi:hypothetical protein BGZ95_002378 [Linnemannia exigua]|uniref:FAD-binding domain-containing protein n=1 Tax=Linnemannia exigua TaxID=604196 RepID=A0AAD4DII5_9FUNG|nr:hypothetical protein BGZ95_002378 [Linnemannia exigua]
MSSQENAKPTVLIVGAGLGGLLLGALLEKSGVPYEILERAPSVKPLGSALSVGPLLLPILQQLGVYEEFLSISKYMTQIVMFNESLKPYKPTDYSIVEEFTGYGYYIVTRPLLYNLLLRQVPSDKIHFGKKVINISDQRDKVTVQTSDNYSYEGDIVVGADGAHSTVRQHMYETLKTKGLLPKSDQEVLPFSCTCLVGQTQPLDPDEFPILKEPLCQFQIVLGKDRPYTWITFTTAQNTISYMIIFHLSKITNKTELEQNAGTSEHHIEWGPHSAKAMCDETGSFPVSLGGDCKMTLADLYDRSSEDVISKVMLEEKVFKTWHSKRMVLMGDACHKLHPSGGQGAVTAMHDAIALANLLYSIPTASPRAISRMFTEYHAERYPAAIESFKNSQQGARVLEKGPVGALALYVSTHAPLWLWKSILEKSLRHRPTIGFLDPIERKGTTVPVVSASTAKARALFEKRQQTQDEGEESKEESLTDMVEVEGAWADVVARNG